MEFATFMGEKPIPGTHPAGVSVRSEASFEELSDEVAKQESVTAGEVDWHKVVELSGEILTNQSKDLLVGVYFCRGVFDTDGFQGLSDGLDMLGQMVETYWADMEPPVKRMRGRVAALTWLMEKLGEAVQQQPAGHDQRDDADRCIAALDRLSDCLSAHRVELDSGSLIRALRSQAPVRTDELEKKSPPKASAAEPVATPDATESAPVEATGPVTAAVAPAQTPQKIDPELRRLVRRCADEMQKLAAVWHERDLRDERAYRFSRLGVWSVVEKAPRNDNGVVDLPPPPRNRLETVLSLFQQKRYAEFIAEAEPITRKQVFWIDGHRLIAVALRGMGEQFEPAARAVADEVLAFIDRVPEVAEYQFSDGTPFASPNTVAWIEQERLKQARGDDAPGEGTPGLSEQWDKASIRATEYANNGDFASVARVFAEHFALARNARARFHWRLTEADFYYRYGHDAIVLGIVEGLMNDTETYRLLEWEPELVMTLANLSVRCADRAGKNDRSPAVVAVRGRAFELMCRLDPGAALTIDQSASRAK